jgi:rhamnosyltransferase
MSGKSVAAIVVTYKPDANSLQQLVAALLGDQLTTIVVDNGGGCQWLGEWIDVASFHLVEPGKNLGIGAAINAGIKVAEKLGATHVITFDQDSGPNPGMVRHLLNEFEQQSVRGCKLAAVGPLFVDPRQSPPVTHPFIRLSIFGSGHRYCTSKSELIPVDCLITSGCLMSLAALRDVGPMDPDYFVDYTDIEWCFRARSRGYKLMGVCGVSMTHELGHGMIRRVLGLNLIEYAALRRYYYFRNTLAVASLNYVPWRWKCRLVIGSMLRLVTLPWAPRASPDLLAMERRMALRGIRDALRGVRGPIVDVT